MTNSEIIALIAAHQARGDVHPLTCGNDSNHENLVAVEVDGKVVLKCNDCDYVQTHIPGFLSVPLFVDPKAMEEINRVAENYRAEDDEPKPRVCQESPLDLPSCGICGSHEWVDGDPPRCARCESNEPLRKRITQLEDLVTTIEGYRGEDAKTIGELEELVTDAEIARNELQRKYNALLSTVQAACMNETGGPVPYAFIGEFDGDDNFTIPEKLPNFHSAFKALKLISEHAGDIADQDDGASVQTHANARIIETLALTELKNFPGE